MPAPSEPESPVDTLPEAVLPAGADTPLPNEDAPPAPPAAPAVERTEGVPAPPAPAAPSAPRPPGLVPPAADLQRQTITIVIQLQPVDGDPAGRPALVSVRAGQGVPLFAAPLRYSALGALPGPVTTLLQQLQLRALEQRHKTPGSPPRPAASSGAPAPAPPSAAAPAAPDPPSALPPLAPPPPPAPPVAPATDPPSTQLMMF